MPTPQIFISYRRDDAAGYARAIGDALGRQFGPERVFIDVDDIAAGQAFDEVIHQAVGGSRVLLVLIGRRWLGERVGQPARIHDSGDLVQREVATALASGMQVIPLLLDGAAMPGPAQLPAALQALAGRNAMAIDNTRFGADLDRLLAALRPLVDPTPVASTPAGSTPVCDTHHRAMGPRRALGATALAMPGRLLPGGLLLGGLLLGGLLLGGLLWVGLRPAAVPPAAGAASTVAATNPPAPAATARPAVNGRWQAEVVYDWPNANFTERFDLSGDGNRLQGSASFLRVARSIDEGTADTSGLRFVTRSTEMTGVTARDTEHRYQGQLVGDELRLTLQTVGGSTPHVPIVIVARRLSASASAPTPASASALAPASAPLSVPASASVPAR